MEHFQKGKTVLDNVDFGNATQKAGLDFDWEILDIEKPADRPPKQLVYLPALFLLGILR